MANNFGDLPIQIADASAPTAPASGLTIFSATGGILKVINSTSTYTPILNPMTSQGDTILAGASGVPARLALGTNGYVYTAGASTASWVSPHPSTMSGIVQLSSGTATVSTAAVGAASSISLTYKAGGTGTPGVLVTTAVSNGVNFTIGSLPGTGDNNFVCWSITNVV